MRVNPPVRNHPKPVFLLEAGYEHLEGVIRQVFEDSKLPLRGARILVKPNMLGPYKPERAVTTDPRVVSTVVDYLREAGAHPMVGDNPGVRGYGINSRCGEITGISSAAKGSFINMGKEGVNVAIDSVSTKEVRISRVVMEADLIISIPKLKTHVQTVMTGGLKNTFGYLIGAEKSRLHSLARSSRDFARILVDIYSIRPPELTIMDAITAMEGDGPSNGHPRHVGKIIASSDALAVDLVASRLIGLDPDKVLFLKEARQRWPDLGRPASVGPAELKPIHGFSLPLSFMYDVKSYMANWLLFSFLKKSRLQVRKEACNLCRTCIESCPVGAISIRDGYPEIDTSSCRACYCCHELCPNGAIELNAILRSLLRGRG